MNLAYYNNKSREWVSVSGTARIVTDRDLIRTLYKPDWKAWFGDEGGDRNGGPNDPRLVLIEVEAHEVTYLKSNAAARRAAVQGREGDDHGRTRRRSATCATSERRSSKRGAGRAALASR